MAAHLGIPLGSFWEDNSDWISALITLALAAAVAFAIDRWFTRRGRHLAESMLGGFSRQTDTRLRFLRRLVYATFLLIGIAIAASQFTGLDRIAASVLASSAIAAAVIGFAARQTLANLVAGLMLIITQPLRVGDWVTFEEHYGVVEDIRLNFTVLRTRADQRVVIPNERLAGGTLVNDTLAGDAVGLEVAIWLPVEADADRALEVLREEAGAHVTIAESSPLGIRLSVDADPVAPPDRAEREADLRERCLRRLRSEGLLASPEPG